MAEWLRQESLGSQSLVDRLVGGCAPSWVPSFVNDLIGGKVYRELANWTWQVQHDPKYDVRSAPHRFLTQLSVNSQNDRKIIAEVEGIKTDILSSAAVTQASTKIWASTSVKLVNTARDPDSLLRRKVLETAARYGEWIQPDPELCKRMGRRLEVTVVFIAESYTGEITSIISETVKCWDADEVSSKIELVVGHNLRFIRINDTVIGSLVDSAIYTLSTLAFGVIWQHNPAYQTARVNM